MKVCRHTSRPISSASVRRGAYCVGTYAGGQLERAQAPELAGLGLVHCTTASSFVASVKMCMRSSSSRRAPTTSPRPPSSPGL